MIIKKDCNETHCSSNIYKVIRPVLNFFYNKISQAPKSTKKHQKALKSTANLRFINLRFIDQDLSIRRKFIRFKRYLSGKNIRLFY